MTINEYCKALVEGCYAANGVKEPLGGSGSNRSITVRDLNFSFTGIGSTVTVPYEYTKIHSTEVPATLTGDEGAGATLGNDAEYILSTIPTVTRGETTSDFYISPATHISDWNFGEVSITVSGKSYSEGHVSSDFTGIKFSRNTNYTINLPAGVTITKVEVKGYCNADDGIAYVTTLGDNTFTEEDHTFAAKETSSHVYTLGTPATGSMVFRPSGDAQMVATLTLMAATTGIATIRMEEEQRGACYNLQGVPVTNPTRGIYIQNGKKIIIK
jgi:hypothetical protein